MLGAERAFCCAGCEAVARTIAGAGFEKYYEARSSAGARPEALPPPEVYDHPGAQREFVAAPREHVREATLILDRIRCAACLWLNERALRRVPGVQRADVNFATQRASIAWDPRVTQLSHIVEAVRAVGYDAYPFDPRRGDALARGERRRALWRLFVAGFGAMQVMMYAWPAYVDAGAGTLTPAAAGLMRWASLLITIPVLAFSCGPFFRGAWQDGRRRRISLDTPIALGLAAGFAASAWATLTGRGEVYFDSIAMLAFLLLAARTAELFARQKAGRELDRLARWMPSFALRLRGAASERVPAHALAAGDRVRVGAGERIPADGVLEAGASSADESLLTGESRPVAKRTGAALVGGSVNLEQPLVMRVTRAGADTRAAAIGRLVERAAAARPELVERADRLAQHLTLIVIATAALAWALSGNVWIAVAVLVATCPCALALAAPIVLTRAGALLLARGAPLTRARALEALERASDVVLDKTGTLTLGRPAIARVVPLAAEEDEARLRALAAALESSSTHPLALAFRTAGPAPALTELRNEAGQGVQARVDGRLMRLGSRRFCEAIAGRRGVAPNAQVYLAEEGRWLAAFFIDDALRPEAPDVVRVLAARGLRVHLVSGDAPRVVGALARRLGIAAWTGGATPQDKLAYVSRLQAQGRVVAMVGDGLNDAPVLARADVSVAMGAGADAAQLQADVVLTADRLGALGELLAISRRAMRLVRQNLGWALAYNALALPAAALGWIGPWEAALGMSASSLVVVLNALRPLAKERTWKASTSSSPSPSPSYS